MVILYSVLCIVYILHFFRLRDWGPLAVAQSSPPLIRHWRQSNSKFRPEKTGIISISLTLACSVLKSLFRFNLTGYMSWWRWMVSDSNKFVLIRSEGKGSVGKQLVLRTASTYQLSVKAPSWSHWDRLLKWRGCTATTRCSVIVGMQITSINETAGFTYCRIPGVRSLYYWRAKRN